MSCSCPKHFCCIYSTVKNTSLSDSFHSSMSSDGIKEELQLYLDEKNLNSLFVTIVEAILTKVNYIEYIFDLTRSVSRYSPSTSFFTFSLETSMSDRFHGKFPSR